MDGLVLSILHSNLFLTKLGYSLIFIHGNDNMNPCALFIYSFYFFFFFFFFFFFSFLFLQKKICLLLRENFHLIE